MRRRRTVTEVARNFSEVITHIAVRGERVDLIRGGKVVAAIVPAPGTPGRALKAVFAELPRPGRREADAMAHAIRIGGRSCGRQVAVRVLMDATVLIALKRGRIDVDRVSASREDVPVLCSVITASELLHEVGGLNRHCCRPCCAWRGDYRALMQDLVGPDELVDGHRLANLARGDRVAARCCVLRRGIGAGRR